MPFFVLVAAATVLGHGWKVCDVTKYGAVADNKTSCTAAFRAATSDCANGGVILVPYPKATPRDDGGVGVGYRTAPFNLTSNMVLEVQPGASIVGCNYTSIHRPPLPSMGGSVVAGGGIGAGRACRYSALISARNATNVTLTGGGTVDGQGPLWWNYDTPEPCGKPMLMEFEYVTGLKLNNINIHNSPSWTVHPYFSQDIHIHHVNITDDNPGNKHFNTDGIDPNSCTDVLIEDYYYCGGDDAIAIKSGWNIAGMLYGKPSKNITVRRSSSGCRGGWTIGSEMSGGVEDVLFEDLTSTSESGIRISAELLRGGFVRNVTFRNLTFDWNVLLKKSFLLEVEQTYPNGGTFPQCTGCKIPPLTPNLTNPHFDSIHFEDITVLHAPANLTIGRLECSITACEDIRIDNLTLMDAPRPQKLNCTGTIHGEQSDADPAVVSPSCIKPPSA